LRERKARRHKWNGKIGQWTGLQQSMMMFLEEENKTNTGGLYRRLGTGAVARVCNPSYLGGRDRKITVSG
jgi:hypothetical protein